MCLPFSLCSSASFLFIFLFCFYFSLELGGPRKGWCFTFTLSFYWSVFSRIRTQCPNTEFFLVLISPHSDCILSRIQSECEKIRTRKNSVFRHFSRSAIYSYCYCSNFFIGVVRLFLTPCNILCRGFFQKTFVNIIFNACGTWIFIQICIEVVCFPSRW